MEITGITLICYLGGLGVKLSPLDNKWIPLLCGILGGVLGLLAMGIMPDFPASNLIDAAAAKSPAGTVTPPAAVGIASGLAATGADQAIRQLTE